MMERIRGLAAVISIAGLAGVMSCGGSGSTGPGCDAIQAALVSRIQVAPASATVTTGDSLQLHAMAFSCAGELPDVVDFSWRGSNDGIATVSSAGLVKAMTSGNATMYASTSGVEGTATILARPPRVAEVRVEPTEVTLGENQSSQLSVRAFDSHGDELTGRTVTWSSSQNSVVSVDDQGQITGTSAGGPVAVVATIDGKADTSLVTVVTLMVAHVNVTPDSSGIGLGGTVQLSARLTDAFNRELTGRVVSWSSTNSFVASVNPTTGLVTGILPGTATVIATSEGKSDSAVVTVTLGGQGSPTR